MCIVCNCGEAGDVFLICFEGARDNMNKAKSAMLDCSKLATDPAARARYDAAHKKIARIVRDFNRIEEERENGEPKHLTISERERAILRIRNKEKGEK